MEALAMHPIAASPLVREAMTRLLSSTPRGFSQEQRKALNDYKGPVQSGHVSDQMVEEDQLS